MTNLELIEQHQKDTCLCSFPGHMRSCSTTYATIIQKDKEILPDILKYLKDNPKDAGMSIILLLQDITKESPYQPESVAGGMMMSYKVKDTIKVWIDWGKKKGLI